MKTQGQSSAQKTSPKATVPETSARKKPAVKPAPRKKVVTPATEGTTRKALKPQKSSATPGLDNRQQTEVFERAMKLFHKKEFAQARELFDQAIGGPLQEIAHTARMHVNMCDRRLQQSPPAPKTAEEKYVYSVALINRGDYEQAAGFLKEAIAANDSADHFHYALALCSGLKGDAATAASHLRRAIEISPANRAAARNDLDFEPLFRYAEIREVLGSQR